MALRPSLSWPRQGREEGGWILHEISGTTRESRSVRAKAPEFSAGDGHPSTWERLAIPAAKHLGSSAQQSHAFVAVLPDERPRIEAQGLRSW